MQGTDGVADGIAGVVLCGGQSRRMGRAKADLPFGEETLLQRVVHTLLGCLERVVIVHAEGQVLPEFDDRVSLVADQVAFEGPLLGILAGMEHCASLHPGVRSVYVTSCDAPFLRTEFVLSVMDQLAEYDVAVPLGERFFYPLAAGYAVEVFPKVQSLVAAGERRPRALFDLCNTRQIPVDQLRNVDPELQSLVNLNSPEDYRQALLKHSLPIPAWLSE